MERCDYLIVGAGIAGASAGYWLSRHGSVIVIERESQPGYHTTGRSAAFFVESYGNEFIRPLTRASRSFLVDPPEGFASTPLLHDRGVLFVARGDQLDALDKWSSGAHALSRDEILEKVPCLRPDNAAAGFYLADAMDIDVNALHQGFLRGIKEHGGRVVTDAGLLAIDPVGGGWRATTPAGQFQAGHVINAAGAWGDEVAALAGARSLKLEPLIRTIVVLPAPDSLDSANWPLVINAGEDFYFKPESGRILTSPGDETPSPPCDIQPDELTVAVTVDRIQKATTLKVDRLENKWAGLRTFAPDRTPVVGRDPEVPGFFWCVGQGGYGIQTAPAMGQMTAALVAGAELPENLIKAGVDPKSYDPARFH